MPNTRRKLKKSRVRRRTLKGGSQQAEYRGLGYYTPIQNTKPKKNSFIKKCYKGLCSFVRNGENTMKYFSTGLTKNQRESAELNRIRQQDD